MVLLWRLIVDRNLPLHCTDVTVVPDDYSCSRLNVIN